MDERVGRHCNFFLFIFSSFVFFLSFLFFSCFLSFFPYFFLSFAVLFFKKGFRCVSWAVLKLTLKITPSLSSQRSLCEQRLKHAPTPAHHSPAETAISWYLWVSLAVSKWGWLCVVNVCESSVCSALQWYESEASSNHPYTPWGLWNHGAYSIALNKA